jgi:hypothetical protein
MQLYQGKQTLESMQTCQMTILFGIFQVETVALTTFDRSKSLMENVHHRGNLLI